MTYDLNNEVRRFDETNDEKERSRIFDNCPSEKALDFIKQVIADENLKKEVKDKLEMKLKEAVVRQKLFLMTLRDDSKVFTGFDKTIPMFTGDSLKLDSK
jgi:hypothetical protein